jgi:hypothetical protein
MCYTTGMATRSDRITAAFADALAERQGCAVPPPPIVVGSRVRYIGFTVAQPDRGEIGTVEWVAEGFRGFRYRVAFDGGQSWLCWAAEIAIVENGA